MCSNLAWLNLSNNELTEIPIDINKLKHLDLKIFENLQVEGKIIDGQKQQPIMLPMVII